MHCLYSTYPFKGDTAEPIHYALVVLLTIEPDELLRFRQLGIVVDVKPLPCKSCRQRYPALPLHAIFPAFEILWYHIVAFWSVKTIN
ncbi:hypothetical protein SAMN05660226_03818 [Parapedobacter luteus]|uniref:Uncharacterized protein n=1 Tax=Parapedobacter luteus TaxID=623280 RepID=A0A1T5F6N0_9SPHI|nr:hypothetical protein SAMN05660226_03818 [Parapedobacter luteus]